MRIDGIEILCDADVKRALRQKFHKAANKLTLSNKAVEKFEETAEADVEIVKKGRRPSAVVAARIYIIGLLAGEARTQRKVAWAAGSSEQLVRELYHVMKERREPRVRNRANSNG